MTGALSQKGSRTRRRIIQAAKRLFYQNGYRKASVNDICRESGIKAGNLTYYFKTKFSLARELYMEVFLKSYEFVETKLDRPMNSLEKNTIVAFIYYSAITAGPMVRRFHLEILERSSPSDYIADLARPISGQFNKDFNLGLTEKDLHDIDMAENGLSRELISHYLANPGKRTLHDLVNTIYIFRARLFTVDENIMKVYLYNGMDFERSFDHSHINLLAD